MSAIQSISSWSFHMASVQAGTHWWNDASTRIPEAEIARSKQSGAMNDTPVGEIDDAWITDDDLDSDKFNHLQSGRG
jgi:hypothetical protein